MDPRPFNEQNGATSVWIVASQKLFSVFIYHIFTTSSMRFAVRLLCAELATLVHGCLAFDRVSSERKKSIEKPCLGLCT